MMSAPSMHLKELLAPIHSEDFFRDHWEKATLAITRGDEQHYAGLLSLPDVDSVIAFTRPKFQDAKVLSSGRSGPATYLRGTLDHATVSPSDNPGIAELRQLFDQGKSVVIMAMQHRRQEIAQLCRNLESTFRCPVHANLYLTPAGSQGFAAHFDPHEVFVLQLEGTKQWRLYGADEVLPLVSDRAGIPRKPLGESREVCLKPGDLLYIPRGHVHEAFTTDSLSLHLTVGINVYRWADLLRHALLSVSQRDLCFRESLPEGALPTDRTRLKRHFQQMFQRLAEYASRDEIFDDAWGALGDQFLGQLQMLPGSQFATPAGLDHLELETVLENRQHTLCRVVDDDQGVAIEFPGNRVGGPARIASALRFIAGVRRFVVGALPDDLNPQAKIVLARRLIREGLLTICEIRSPLTLPARESPPRGFDETAAPTATIHWDAAESASEMQQESVSVES